MELHWQKYLFQIPFNIRPVKDQGKSVYTKLISFFISKRPEEIRIQIPAKIGMNQWWPFFSFQAIITYVSSIP